MFQNIKNRMLRNKLSKDVRNIEQAQAKEIKVYADGIETAFKAIRLYLDNKSMILEGLKKAHDTAVLNTDKRYSVVYLLETKNVEVGEDNTVEEPIDMVDINTNELSVMTGIIFMVNFSDPHFENVDAALENIYYDALDTYAGKVMQMYKALDHKNIEEFWHSMSGYYTSHEDEIKKAIRDAATYNMDNPDPARHIILTKDGIEERMLSKHDYPEDILRNEVLHLTGIKYRPEQETIEKYTDKVYGLFKAVLSSWVNLEACGLVGSVMKRAGVDYGKIAGAISDMSANGLNAVKKALEGVEK